MLKHTLKSVSETVSQVGIQLLHDPASTISKMKTKVGFRFRIISSRRGTNGSNGKSTSYARELFESGLLSQVKQAKVSNLFQLVERNALNRAAQFQLGFLQSSIEPSLSRTTPVETERPLYVLTSSLPYTQSGYTVRSHFLLAALKETGVEVEAITRSGYPASIGTVTSSQVRDVDGVRYRLNSHWFARLSFKRQLKQAVAGLVREAREHEATILITTTDYRNAIVVSRAAQELEIPWVYEIRGELEETWLSRVQPKLSARAQKSEYYLLSQKQERAARSAAASVFVISEQIRQKVRREGISDEKLRLLPNAIDFIDLNSVQRSGVISSVPGLSSAERIIGSISAIVEYEGLDTLIRSLKNLPEGVHALIVGDGADRPRLERLTDELQLSPRVHFVGKKPMASIIEWYKAFDVFVVPRVDSRLCRNVTPIKAMQAQALGIPVVASDLPALREVTGEFAEYSVPENPNDLARKVSKVIEKLGTPDMERENLLEWLQTRTWESNAATMLDTFKAI